MWCMMSHMSVTPAIRIDAMAKIFNLIQRELISLDNWIWTREKRLRDFNRMWWCGGVVYVILYPFFAISIYINFMQFWCFHLINVSRSADFCKYVYIHIHMIRFKRHRTCEKLSTQHSNNRRAWLYSHPDHKKPFSLYMFAMARCVAYDIFKTLIIHLAYGSLFFSFCPFFLHIIVVDNHFIFKYLKRTFFLGIFRLHFHSE